MSTMKIWLFNAAVFFSTSGGTPEEGNSNFLGEIINTIKNGFSNIATDIFGRLGDEMSRIILEFLQTQLINLFNWLSGIILNFSSDVFSNPIIVSWFSVVSLLAKLCFFVGLTIYIANACIKMSSGRKLLMASDLKTYMFYLVLGWFGVDGAVIIFREVNTFLANNLITQNTQTLESDVLITYLEPGGVAIVEIVMLIVVIICFVSFLISVMKRIGYIFALISVIPIYMLSFSKGYSSGFFSWLRMFASCTITFFLQYIIFYLGINILIANKFVLAVLFFVSIPVVPLVLAQFGSGTTTMGDILSDVTSTAKQGVSMATSAATGI